MGNPTQRGKRVALNREPTAENRVVEKINRMHINRTIVVKVASPTELSTRP